MKIYGLLSDFAPVRQDASRIVISFDLQRVDDEHCTWHEVCFYKKQNPSLSNEQIKATIIAYIDDGIKKNITEGFVWNGIKVPLSMTDQTNYKRVLDLASQTKSANLPCDFWFGTSDEPVKQTFENVADLRQFWLAADAHINKCIAEGREFKASFDWSPYEI